MTGKPGGRPAAPKPPSRPPQAKLPPGKKPDPSANIPAVGKPAAAPAPKPKPPDDDDPFAIDSSESANAVAVSPRMGGGRTLEVACPMCETKGYVAPKAAGQLVKCCNPKCLVPVFTAPAIERKQAVADPEPKAHSSAGLFIVGSVGAILVVVVAGVWYFMFNEPATPKPRPGLPTNIPPLPRAITTADPEKATAPASNGATPAPPLAGKSPRELMQQEFTLLVEASRDASTSRKPFCRRLAIQACLDLHDAAGVEEQLEQLQKVTKKDSHEAVLPFVALGWQSLADQRDAELKSRLDDAISRATSLPIRSRYPAEAAGSLAALLVAAGRVADAQAILDRHHISPADDNLAAALLTAYATGNFNIDRRLPARSFNNWQAPLETGVTLVLAAHDRQEAAQAWAASQVDATARTECTLAFAEALAHNGLQHNQPEKWKLALHAGQDLSPAGHARLLARLAALQLDAGEQGVKSATDLAAQAQSRLDSIQPPSPIRFNRTRDFLEFKPADSAPLKLAVLAAHDLAEVQTRLKQLESAWKNVETALAFTRGMAPSPSYIRYHDRRSRQPGFPAQLMHELDLKNEDQARRAANDFKQRCSDMLKTSAARLQLQVSILGAAADWNLLDQVWETIRTQSGITDLNDQDPLLTTSLPDIVSLRYEAVGNQEKQTAIQELRRTVSRPGGDSATDPYPYLSDLASHFADAGNAADAAQTLLGVKDAAGVLDDCWLRLSCRLASHGKFAEALQLLVALPDSVLREDGLRLIAALAASQRATEQFKAAVKSKISSAAHTEMAAISAGIISGLATLTGN